MFSTYRVKTACGYMGCDDYHKINEPGAICTCKPGWNGIACDEDPCFTKPCKNAGLCSGMFTLMWFDSTLLNWELIKLMALLLNVIVQSVIGDLNANSVLATLIQQMIHHSRQDVPQERIRDTPWSYFRADIDSQKAEHGVCKVYEVSARHFDWKCDCNNGYGSKACDLTACSSCTDWNSCTENCAVSFVWNNYWAFLSNDTLILQSRMRQCTAMSIRPARRIVTVLKPMAGLLSVMVRSWLNHTVALVPYIIEPLIWTIVGL